MSRGFPAAVTAACFAFATLAAPSMIGFDAAQAEATVKSSKSNTSDRMGGGGGKGQAGRMGGGGGKGQASRMGGGGGKGGVRLNPQPEPPGIAKTK